MNTANSVRITQTAETIAHLMGIEVSPACDRPIDVVLKKADKAFGGNKADRVLLYNPDAIALWLYQKYNWMFEGVMLNSELTLPVRSVMPSVTPVCFGSMYTGLVPQEHGIMSYEKPVLKCRCLFDALIDAGLKPAIVSTKGDSLSEIYLERDMDYFFFDTPDECNEKALELMKEDKHDVIMVYNANYDAEMHRWAPEGERPLEALQHNSRAFAAFADAIDKYWGEHRTVLAYLPDHGCHEIDGGLGSHGLDMPDDMNIVHFYSFRDKK